MARLFKALELFYDTNVYDAIDGVLGNDLEYSLSSDEPGAGGTRNFRRFTELNLADLATNLNSVDSPEGENGISRIFLGIHWVFDATDGIRLGNAIAQDVNANYFFAVPEPGSCLLALIGGILAPWASAVDRKRHRLSGKVILDSCWYARSSVRSSLSIPRSPRRLASTPPVAPRVSFPPAASSCR